jgi:hypothetical protein
VTDAALSPEEQLIEDIASFTHDPLGYALYAFPWGEDGTELAHASGPRQWQADAFREIGEHLQNPATRHQPLMISRASGHGIGDGITGGSLQGATVGVILTKAGNG